MAKEQYSDISDESIHRVIQRVLEAEKAKLNMGNPKGIKDDIEQIIEEEIN